MLAPTHYFFEDLRVSSFLEKMSSGDMQSAKQ